MAIGITAVIKPSKILLSLMFFMIFLSVSSIFFALYLIRNAEYFYSILVIFLLLICLLIRVQWFYVKKLQTIQLEISNKGEMLVRYIDLQGSKMVDYVQLQPHSVLWPSLMILILKSHERGTLTLPILIDSVEKSSFHRLSVSLRWIANHY